MARILIATVPIAGHVGPFIPVARMLRAAGHEVGWYTGAKFAKAPNRAGVPHFGYQIATDFDDADFDASFPGRESLKGLAQLRYDMKKIFIDSVPGQLADLEKIQASFEPDLLLSDPGMIGAVMLAEKTNLPCGVIGILPLVASSVDVAPFGLGLAPGSGPLSRLRNRLLNWLVKKVLFGDVQRHWLAMRKSVGMEPTDWWMDAGFARITFWLQPTIPAFEYPRSDLAASVSFGGVLQPEPPSGVEDPPFWSELDAGKPIVHITQGTLANTAPRLFKPALEALANEDVLVVISTGGRTPAELGLESLPSNARVATFLDYGRFLPKVSVMVTNGGYGGVQLALREGIPLVVAGTSEDKPEVAARVEWSGAGINLRTEAPSAAQVKNAVRRILAEDSFRTHAHRLKADYARYDALNVLGSLVDKALRKPTEHAP